MKRKKTVTEAQQWDPEILALYEGASDEELLGHIRALAQRLGRPPNKAEVPGFAYIKKRLGAPWPRILERAGVKEVSEGRLRKLESRALSKQEKGRQKTVKAGSGDHQAR